MCSACFHIWDAPAVMPRGPVTGAPPSPPPAPAGGRRAAPPPPPPPLDSEEIGTYRRQADHIEHAADVVWSGPEPKGGRPSAPRPPGARPPTSRPPTGGRAAAPPPPVPRPPGPPTGRIPSPPVPPAAPARGGPPGPPPRMPPAPSPATSDLRPDALFKTMAYGSTQDDPFGGAGAPSAPSDPFGPPAPSTQKRKTKDTFDFGTGLDLAPRIEPPAGRAASGQGADPFATAGSDPFAAPPRDPFTAAPADPFAAAPADPFASAGDPFGGPPSPPPRNDPFAGPPSPPPRNDPFATAPPATDPFAAPPSPPPRKDPFATAPPATDPFSANPFAADPDPYAAPSDPFGAPPPRDPFAAPPSATTSPASDPFGAPPPRDPFAAPPTATTSPSDPFGAPPPRDPFGAAPADPFAAPTASDPFGGPPPSDPFAAPAHDDPFGPAPSSDPFAAPTASDHYQPLPGAPYVPPRQPAADPRQASTFHVQAAAGKGGPGAAMDAGTPGADESLFELDVPDAPLSERAPGQRGPQRPPPQRRRQRSKKKNANAARTLVLAVFGLLIVGLSLGLTEYGFFGIDAMMGKPTQRTAIGPMPPPTTRAKKKTVTVLLGDSGADYTQRLGELMAANAKEPQAQDVATDLALTLARFHERHPGMYRADPTYAETFKKVATPEMLAAHKALDAWDLLAQGRLDEAAKRLDGFIDEQRSPGQDLYLAGRVAQRRGEPERAMQYYELALERVPGFEPIMFEIGRLRAEAGQKDEARKALETLRKANPRHVGAALALAELALSEQDYAQTEALVKAVLPAAAEAKDREAQFQAFRLGARLSELQGKVEDRIYSLERAHEIRPRDEETALTLSRLLAEAGKTQDALSRLQACHKAGCESPAFYLALVARYVEAGHKENAKNHLSEALEKHPSDTGLLMQQAAFDKQIEQWNTAKATYALIIGNDPGYGRAYLELAQLQSREGLDAEALETLRQGLDKARDRQQLMEPVAELQVAMGATLQARETMRQLLELEPDNVGVKLRFAVLLKQLDQSEESLKYFKELAEADKLDAVARGQYAEVLLRLGRHDEALAEVTRVLEKDPLNLQANILRGMVNTAREDFKAADDDLRKALRVNPESARAFHQLALNELAQGRLQPAAEYLAKATDLAPDDLGIRFDLARVLTAIGGADNRKKAITQYTSIMRVYAGYTSPLDKRQMRPEVYFNRGQLHYDNGKFAQALEDFRAALLLAPGRGDLMVEFAKTLANMGRPEEAKAYLAKVLEDTPTHPGANFQMAVIALKEGRRGPAEEHFKTALAKGGSARFADAHRYLGYLYKERNLTAPMCSEFREYLKYAPKDSYDRSDVVQLLRRCR